MSEKPRVLVTGASGFIGSCLVRQLAQQGYSVIATSRRQPAFLAPGALGRVKFIPSDLTKPETLGPLMEGVGRIYHLGALFDFAAPESVIIATNVAGTRALAEAALASGVKEFIQCSSAAVYGIEYGPRRCIETDATRPKDKYASSKLAGEQAAFEYNSKGLKVQIHRPGAVYGPGAKYGDAVALRLLKMGLLMGVPGLRDIASSHIHVEDCARAMIVLSENPAAYKSGATAPHELAVNLVDDTPKTTRDLLDFARMHVKVGLLGFWPWLRLPATFMKLLAIIVENGSKLLGITPLFEVDSINYIAYDHCASNERMRKLGVDLKYPETFAGLAPTIRWYNETNWSVFREKDPTVYLLPAPKTAG